MLVSGDPRLRLPAAPMPPSPDTNGAVNNNANADWGIDGQHPEHENSTGAGTRHACGTPKSCNGRVGIEPPHLQVKVAMKMLDGSREVPLLHRTYLPSVVRDWELRHPT